jgi:hypothetical protein
MVATGRSTALRRAGSFLTMLAFEVGAVVLLTRLGNLPSLRIPWHSLTPWIVDSPVEDVLAAILRTIALLVAWWLLASNVLYLLARLTHVPSAIRAVRWVTLPVVRTATDHALAITLATSLMGAGAGTGTALAATTPVVATAPQRSGAIAAETWQRTAGGGPLGYAPSPAGSAAPQEEIASPGATLPGYLPRPAGAVLAQQPAPKPGEPGYVPRPAGGVAQPAPPSESTTTTTTTEAVTTTTGAATTTTEAAATTTTERATTTTEAATTTQAPTTTVPPTTAAPPSSTTPPRTTPPSTTTPPTTSPATTTTIYIPRPAGSPTTTTTTGPRSTTPPAPPPSTTGPPSGGGNQAPAPAPQPAPPGQSQPSGSHRVVQGDNLWTISRDHIAAVTNRRSSDLSDHEIATYWLRVIAVNRSALRSGNPDLIFPGELIMLPPVSTQA